MRRTNDHYLQLRDDGTPRRKHDIDPKPESHPILSTTIGLLLMNAFIVLKNTLYPTAAREVGSGGSAIELPPIGIEDADEIAAADIQDEIAAADSDHDAEIDAPHARGGSSTYKAAMQNAQWASPDEPIVSYRPSALLSPGNDNEHLYGAAPGSGIHLPNEGVAFFGFSRGVGSGGEGEDEVAASEGPRRPGGPGRLPRDTDENPDDTDNGGRQPNRLPVVPSSILLQALLINEADSFTKSELLRGASDPDGQALQVSGVTASSGHIVTKPDGTWLYVPEFNNSTLVTITYRIGDGIDSVTQTAFLPVVPLPLAPIAGSSLLIGGRAPSLIEGSPDTDTIIAQDGNDVVIGGDGNDRIFTGGGNDIVYAGAGDDVVFSGAGDDVVYGEAGNDTVLLEEGDDFADGGEGNDAISGGDGDDSILGDDGDDDLSGDAGHDHLDGGSGNDTLSGGDGNDIALGGAGHDHVSGGSQDDRIFGNAGNDHLMGDDGDDQLDGGDGNDHLDGGAGADTFIAASGDGSDDIDGGDGSDTYDASSLREAVIIDLDNGTVETSDGQIDDIEDIENAIAGNGNDEIVAGTGQNDLSGGQGQDCFIFLTSAAAGNGEGTRDRILDFEVGDRINIDHISEEFENAFNEIFSDPGIRKFVLIAQNQEFSRPGEVRFKYDGPNDNPVTILEGNIDRDADTEFQIEFVGLHEFRNESFGWS